MNDFFLYLSNLNIHVRVLFCFFRPNFEKLGLQKKSGDWDVVKKKKKVGNDHEMAQSERNSHSKNRGGIN